jgi:hypothetical protein
MTPRTLIALALWFAALAGAAYALYHYQIAHPIIP